MATSGAPITVRIVISLSLMALLVVASLVPGGGRADDSLLVRAVARTPQSLQKSLHVVLYGVLTTILVWTLEPVEPAVLRFATAFVIAVALGAAMEWCQKRVPGRFGTLADLGLDASGAVLGLLAAALLF